MRHAAKAAAIFLATALSSQSALAQSAVNEATPTGQTQAQPQAQAQPASQPSNGGLRIVYSNESALDVNGGNALDGPPRMGSGLFIAGAIVSGVTYAAGVTLGFLLNGGLGFISIVPAVGPIVSDAIFTALRYNGSFAFAIDTLPMVVGYAVGLPMLIVGSRHFTQAPVDRSQRVRRSAPAQWALLPTTNGLSVAGSF